jgi:hypothetical protein
VKRPPPAAHYLRQEVVDVLPIRTETWKAGTYIFAVAVDHAPDRGQTLTSVLMD